MNEKYVLFTKTPLSDHLLIMLFMLLSSLHNLHSPRKYLTYSQAPNTDEYNLLHTIIMLVFHVKCIRKDHVPTLTVYISDEN